MRSYHKLLPGLLILFVFLGSVCHGATITGTVRGPDGAPFAGAFIQAQNTKSGITVMILSDDQGRPIIRSLIRKIPSENSSAIPRDGCGMAPPRTTGLATFT